MLSTRLSAGDVSARGFSLIELIVVITLLAILLMKAFPSYTEWVNNTKVRSTAESVQNGLMLAKAEAVRRNAKVQFLFTGTAPTSANVNTVTASTSGTSWMVRVYESGGSYTASDYIQGRNAVESDSNVAIGAGLSNYIFSGTGTVYTDSGGSIALITTSPNLINITKTGATRNLRVTVEVGGAVRMCDPGLSISSNAAGC